MNQDSESVLHGNYEYCSLSEWLLVVSIPVMLLLNKEVKGTP